MVLLSRRWYPAVPSTPVVPNRRGASQRLGAPGAIGGLIGRDAHGYESREAKETVGRFDFERATMALQCAPDVLDAVAMRTGLIVFRG